MTTASNPLKLAKYVSELRACSRRDAEHYIAGGWVSVDGVIVEQPNFIIQNQSVKIDETANLKPILPVTIVFHKPAGYDFGLTHDFLMANLKNKPTYKSSRQSLREPLKEPLDQPSQAKPELTPEQQDLIEHDALQLIKPDSQAKDDRSNIRPLRSHFQRLIPTVALESAASGLVVYTQDRNIARKLIDDASRVEQEFIVKVAGSLSVEDLKRLNQGFYSQGQLLAGAKVSWQNEDHLRIALKNVKLNQIETMCQAVGLQVLEMKRIRIGRFSMAKLAVGEWRYLLGYERF